MLDDVLGRVRCLANINLVLWVKLGDLVGVTYITWVRTSYVVASIELAYAS